MSNSIKLGRTFREGWKNFLRNGWLSVATVTVFTLSMLIVSTTFILGLASSKLLGSLEEKLNVNVAFNTDVPESAILDIKSQLERYGEVSSVDYTSRDQALEQFLRISDGDPSITKALEEIGDNPLPASLTIHAHYPEQYDTIAKAVAESGFKDQISRVNYEKNRKIIDSVAGSGKRSREVGFVLAIVFVAVSVIVALNTIRINMHSRRQEFEIMRLVGASNTYMRMPSVFEGIFYGTAAAILAFALSFPVIKLIGSVLVFSVAPGFLMQYFLGHFFWILSAMLALGWMLGALSGSLAVGKYSKV